MFIDPPVVRLAWLIPSNDTFDVFSTEHCKSGFSGSYTGHDSSGPLVLLRGWFASSMEVTWTEWTLAADDMACISRQWQPIWSRKNNNMNLKGLEGQRKVGHDVLINKFEPCYPSLHILDSIAGMDLYPAL